jgi:hypothetical protein
MKITELLLDELDREAVGIRKTLERVPEGKNGRKAHEKSMPLGYLTTIVATIPAWLDVVVIMDELDINPPGGPKFTRPARSPVNASTAPSRAAPLDSGPMWVATSHSYDSFIH